MSNGSNSSSSSSSLRASLSDSSLDFLMRLSATAQFQDLSDSVLGALTTTGGASSSERV